MKPFLTLLLLLCLNSVFASGPKHQYLKITTAQGECIIMLYNKTPQHRDNIVKLVKRFYDGTLFHRVINSRRFREVILILKMHPQVKNWEMGMSVILCLRNSTACFTKGVLAAARDDNPLMASSGCQFYLVQEEIHRYTAG
ncbi:hypothetical protein CS542_00210 [Pedobacter sp. IW39]|nr:hypothetical protein CS542_00210 [Pedobacter sp. IW39]